MNKQLLYFVLLLFSFTGKAQTYGNEWINYSQKYYKFKIISDGVYRIDSATIAGAGIDLSSVTPQAFQLFGRGKEIPIFIKGETDGVINKTDFIEFYAEHNDGFMDVAAYDTASHPNPYYSLFSDTATYFLTWNANLPHLRFTTLTNTDFNAFTPINYFFKEEVIFRNTDYYAGPTTEIGSTDPRYSRSEGWFDRVFVLGSAAAPYNFATQYVYQQGPDAVLDFAAVGASNDFSVYNDHRLLVQYKNALTTNYLTLYDTLFEGYHLIKKQSFIPLNTLNNNGVTEVKFSSISNPSFPSTLSNRTAISYAKLRFAHSPDLENKNALLFYLPDHPLQSHSLLSLTNINTANQPVYFFDLNNYKRGELIKVNTTYNVLEPNTGNEKKCFIAGESSIKNIYKLSPVSNTAQFTDYIAKGMDSAFIIITHKVVMNEALLYANYRKSNNYNKQKVLVADIDELYDQYAYGIMKHPLAIKQFANYALNKTTIAPSYLFLIGKDINTLSWRKSAAGTAEAEYYNKSLVPSIGYPCSDMLLTAGLKGTSLEPAIPTGRLAAETPQQVIDYLDKIKAYESAPIAEWKKRVIHFGGGINKIEQDIIAEFLQNYKTIIQRPAYGAKVYTYLKNTSSPIQITLSDSIRNLISSGVSVMTFFGHASGSNFDQNLDSPTKYNNTGRYPVLLANSCFTGDIHQPVTDQFKSSSEEWVLAPKKGVIAYIASGSKELAYALDLYSTRFYTNFCTENYDKSIGYNLKETVKSTQNTDASDPYISGACLSMTLHGDPSLTINTHQKPDFAIADSNIFFSPKNAISTQLDSFNVSVLVTNLGRATYDTIDVELKRIFPDGKTVALYTKQLKSVFYKDTITFRLPIEKVTGAGLNFFEIRVDPLNKISEAFPNNKLNNNVTNPGVSLFINSGDIAPIYPYPFAIVPNNKIILKASTSEAFMGARKYKFEIDTTDTFYNPINSNVVQSSGGIITWDPALTLKDSTVYYWRVRRDTTDQNNYRWKESSFQYIKNKQGWEQAHFFQFKNNNNNFISFNRLQRQFDFFKLGKTLQCDNYGQIPGKYNFPSMTACIYKIDVNIMEYSGCGFEPSMYIAIIDPITLKPWGKHWVDNVSIPAIEYNRNHSFGNANDLDNCRSRVENYFIFHTSNAAQLAGMKRMLADSVPNGYYILAYTWIKSNISSWADKSALDLFEGLGAKSIKTIPDTVPYIFFVKKGYPLEAIEVVGKKATDFIQLSTTLKNNNESGTITSEPIGPASRWDSISWQQASLEKPSTDSVRLNIIGINNSGKEVILQHGIPADSANFYIKNINAVNYPYLKLNIFLQDNINRTSAQLKKWQVFYTPVPEIAVDPKLFFSFKADTLQQGDSVHLKLAVKNVSNTYMDSMLVTYWIIDKNNSKHKLSSYMSKPLAADSSLITSISFSTMGYEGLNSLWMEINPVNQSKTKREQYHFNNSAQLTFFVGRDKTNPLLDVTFDGIHILNGDIVSSKPNILISLRDENKFLALNDTADFAIYLKQPDMQVAQQVYFNNTIIFTKANLPGNSCKLNYIPQFIKDGKYELIVQAKDRSGNFSGTTTFRIQFEVVTISTITEVLNYPNPFSTKTHFVFTLTGSEIPTHFQIQILTITGKVVRQITKDELGPIHIGRNITQYAWDGKDDFGGQLANGVYFYKVNVKFNDWTFEKRETSASQYFTKGFGKMYLMR